MLDVATGAGGLALAFAPNVDSVDGVDLSPAMLERAEAARSATGLSNVHFRLGEIGVLPLQEDAYDIITCHNLLQYVLDVPAPHLVPAPARLRWTSCDRRACG